MAPIHSECLPFNRKSGRLYLLSRPLFLLLAEKEGLMPADRAYVIVFVTGWCYCPGARTLSSYERGCVGGFRDRLRQGSPRSL